MYIYIYTYIYIYIYIHIYINIYVVGRCHHLVEEQLSPLLFPEVHLLHGHLLAAVLLAGDAHDARGALADLDEAVQVLARVACRFQHKRGAQVRRINNNKMFLVGHYRSFFPTWVDHQLEGGSELLVRDSGGLRVRAGPPGRRRVGPRGDVGRRRLRVGPLCWKRRRHIDTFQHSVCLKIDFWAEDWPQKTPNK